MIRLLQEIRLSDTGRLVAGEVCTLPSGLEAALIAQGVAERVAETREAPYQQAVLAAPQRKRRALQVVA
jgi:hypothetical protein